MNTQCPKCKQVFETEENAVGQWVKCPECGGEWCVLTPDEEQKIIDAERQKAIEEAKPKPAEEKEKKKSNIFFDLLYLLRALLYLIITVSIVFGIPVALIVWGVRSCSSVVSQPSSGSYRGKIDAWVFTQYLVEQHLKSPKSARFEYGGAERVEETVSGIYIIRSYVDAKNAFGAEIRQHFFCKLQRKPDGKFEVLQLTFQ